MSSHPYQLALFLLVVTFLVEIGFAAPPLPDASERAFTAKVLPLLHKHCAGCHGESKRRNDLQLTTLGGVLRGGSSGPVIQPSRPDESLLVHLIQADGDPHMPPKGQLSNREIRILTSWIESLPMSLQVDKPGRDVKHWSFLPLKRPAIPTIENRDWPRNPIDTFILAAIEARGLSPSPRADARRRVRRAAFDLVGLPPSRSTVEAFVAGSSRDEDGAWQKTIDRLLGSPGYGERWGRHWLDLARYADSNGFEFDFERPHAWHYRDWVIDSLNEGKPYDQFVMEQLAGDEIAPNDFSSRVATGFCRNGPTVGNQTLEKHRWDELDDVISATAEVFMGLTLGCARCHDHKYDPITQRDYYAMLAIFNTTAKRNHLMGDAKVRQQWSRIDGDIKKARKKLSQIQNRPTAGDWKLEAGELVQRRLANDVRLLIGGQDWTDYTVEVDVMKTAGTEEPFNFDAGISIGVRASDIDSYYALRLGINDNRELGLANEDNGGRAPIAVNVAGSIDKQRWYRVRVSVAGTNIQAWLDEKLVFNLNHARHANGGIVFGNWLSQSRWRNLRVRDGSGKSLMKGFPDLASGTSPKFKADDVTTDDLKLRIRQLESKSAQLPFAMSIIDESRTPRETRFFHRGNYRTPGPVVEPAVPAVLSRTPIPFPPAPKNAKTTGRRTALAQWMVSHSNPLAARVMVNRIWQFHFGRGLVATPSNFGLNGAPPSHPRLLDWLATEFIASGYSIKRMHRLIMSSATYQQASRDRKDASALDPDNALFWRFPRRRLEAELIRDSILAASGALNDAMHGPGVHPRIHASALATSTTRKWPTVVQESSQHWRRSVYIFSRRSMLMPMLESFDAPVTTQSCAMRMTTTVPTQALQLMNDQFTNEQAGLMATDIAEKRKSMRHHVDDVFWRTLSRPPSATERADCRLFLAEQVRYHQSRRSEQSEKSPYELALADLCHVMFNLNEFVYVD